MYEKSETEPIILTDEDGGEIKLVAVDQTRIAGVDYLLACEESELSDEGYEEVYIFRMTEEGDDLLLDMVTDDSEFQYIAKVFSEQADDSDAE